MKSFILRAGLFTCLIFLGWSYEQASAATTWPSKCTSLGTIVPNQNPNPQQINCLLTNAALAANIPPEVVKAVAAQESDWKQYDANGQPLITQDGGIGIMQITNQSNYDQEELKNDITYNIQAGVEILNSLYYRTNLPLPKIINAGPEVIENWYFPVMAYNGTKPVNSPLYQADGSKNTNAYQEKVFALLEHDSFLDGTKLAQFPFSTADFSYQSNSDQNIIFNKLEYTITDQLHATAYLYQTGDKVAVTMDSVKLRSQPDSSSSVLQLLGKNTPLIINGDFAYDLSNSNNRFVWYPVKTADQKVSGYISSAYITKLTGWITQNGMRYHYTNGVLTTGWYKDGTNYYYLDPSNGGAMKTGWLQINTQKFYLDLKTGVKITSSWVLDGGKYYYFNAYGVLQTGWLKYGNAWYYLGNNGIMQTGWVKYGQDWYFLASNGKMQTGWQKISGKWYYFYSNGKMAHDTRIGRYRIGHNGAMI